MDESRAMVAGAVLVLCGCTVTATPALNPQDTRPAQSLQAGEDALPLPNGGAPGGLKRGLYVLASSNIYGFPANSRDNKPPFCSFTSPSNPPSNNIAFDTKGRMIVPSYAAATIAVYAAPTSPKACGKLVGVIRDPYGQPVDAASVDAVSGRIVVAADPEQVDVCTLRRGCTKSFDAPNLDPIASIALSRNGDCWAEGDGVSGPGTLDYFKGCDGAGQGTTGYFGDGDNYGGLDIDKHGNIVSILANYHNSPAVYVYSGCNPACSTLGGPLPLRGNGTYGRLNEDSTEFAAADYQNSSIDVYKYSPRSLTFEYSFSSGLSDVEGVAFNPSAQQ
jgi:hypothetical protein